ncbi:TylF/MycF/NovP-related O-methyltransferase [Rhodoferax sp. UBA5149]|uniref:TylF/MycF/NovP-related O-methyltransferase n=1 Tax=Rhodoferax sp. UBA5149 TaxID=1947379 RepID=UPI0025CF040A|nr:TylF/MycF/NovP-related O-methyltransferase [Rhodoferax sp. UBA5149]
MEKIPDIHLCIQQPPGYVHSLGLLDQARYFRYQFRRLGANVSISKNRLRHDAVNLIFGAHLGFDPAQRERHACIFVNLEQLGDGGAAVSPDYLRLLATSAATDYDVHNVAAYATCTDDVTVVPLLHAPYLVPEQSVPLNERPIDLLFIGSMNPRRRAWIDRIEACGLSVTLFDGPLYGPERDQFIVQAKAVVNVHFYESSRFEQARVSHCLSLGTPVIAERTVQTRPHPAFEDCVLWMEGEGLEQFFTKDFGTPAFYEATREALLRFEQADPIDAYAELLGFATGFVRAHHERRPAQPWQPQCINLGSGKDYKPGWLNIDLLERTEPDLLLDLALPLALPFSRVSPRIGPIVLAEQSIDIIHANNVLEHVPDLVSLMGNCLRLLKTGGELQIEVPFERAPTAWQDPTHVRAMNEKSWIYYTDWFWYLGWFEHRFEMTRFVYLDSSLKECGLKQAAFMRVVLRKTETTPRERNTARAMQADLRLPEDAVDPAQVCIPQRPEKQGQLLRAAYPAFGHKFNTATCTADLYLNLMESVLLGVIYEDPPIDQWSGGVFNPELRSKGRDWPAKAHTMIGFERLRNVRHLMNQVINDKIPGDFVETGVWRGGACIYMRAVLKAFGIVDRTIWVADSFAGLPMPDSVRYPSQDLGDLHHTFDALAVSLETVQENFRKYELLDEQVKFLKGWFKDTLPAAPIDHIALLRLDGDMYSSTMDALQALGHKVSPGGFIVVDDFGAVEGCRKAIADYRMEKGITAPIHDIDGIGAYWRVAA